MNSKPKVSEGSQFHQPPHVPSCTAHQLPKKRATRETIKEKGDHKYNCLNWRTELKEVVGFKLKNKIKTLKVKKVPE